MLFGINLFDSNISYIMLWVLKHPENPSGSTGDVSTVHATSTNMNDNTGSYRLSLLLSEALDSVKLIFAEVYNCLIRSLPIAIY